MATSLALTNDEGGAHSGSQETRITHSDLPKTCGKSERCGILFKGPSGTFEIEH